MELMPMPPIISLISFVQAVTRLISRREPSSGSSRFMSSGSCVAMPQLHLPVWQERHMWQPIAMSAAVAACGCTQPVTVCGSACVAKSYPAFWEDFTALQEEAL